MVYLLGSVDGMRVFGMGTRIPVWRESGMHWYVHIFSIRGKKNLAMSEGLLLSLEDVMQSNPGDLFALKFLMMFSISV